MDDFQIAMLKYMSDLKLEINEIKSDVTDIKVIIKLLQKEHEEYMSGFPYGIDSHRNDHIKKKWFLF